MMSSRTPLRGHPSGGGYLPPLHLGELLEEGVVPLEADLGALEHLHQAEVLLGLHLARRRELVLQASHPCRAIPQVGQRL